MAQRSRFNKANVLVCGSNGVGKTALIVRFITKRFIGDYDQVKETVYSHRIPATLTSAGAGGGSGSSGEMVLEILDPAQSTDESQLETHIRWADGLVLVYSVTDRASFDRLQPLFETIQRLRPPDESTPIVIVANKADCPGFARKVPPEDGQRLAKRLDRPLLELSVAESPDGVAEAMNALIGQIKREHIKVRAGLTNQKSPFTNVKRVIREKIYSRSRSDTTMIGRQRSPLV